MSTTATRRKTILAGFKTLLEGLYGPSGTTGKWFREVRRGPLQPVSAYPVLTIQDGGQKRIEDEESDNSWAKDLTVLVVLQLAEDWTKVSAANDWSDRVEAILNAVNRNRTLGSLITRLDYTDDDPADVVFLSGQSCAIWQIQFNVQYADGV